jgi:hypothetical protein
MPQTGLSAPIPRPAAARRPCGISAAIPCAAQPYTSQGNCRMAIPCVRSNSLASEMDGAIVAGRGRPLLAHASRGHNCVICHHAICAKRKCASLSHRLRGPRANQAVKSRPEKLRSNFVSVFTQNGRYACVCLGMCPCCQCGRWLNSEFLNLCAFLPRL